MIIDKINPKTGDHRLVRSHRKTLAIEVKASGEVIVRAPQHLSQKKIKNFVEKNQPWIDKKKKEFAARTSPKVPVSHMTTQLFWYLGQRYPVQLIDGQATPLQFGSLFLLSRHFLPVAPQLFLRWYREQAKQIIPQRVAFFATTHGFQPTGVSITRAKTRWGSCSQQGRLSFAWRLIMAPLSVIDYVVVHELAHLRELNHSPAFWRHVAAILPNYAAALQWLRHNGHKLDLPITVSDSLTSV